MSAIRTLLLATALVTYASPAADYATLYRETVAAWRAGDMDRALSLQQEALLLRPDFPGMLENIAQIQLAREDAPGVLAALERMAALGYATTLPMDSLAPLIPEGRIDALRTRFDRNAAPAGEATTAYALDLPRFIPEGIAYDAARDVLYLGSIHLGVIVAVAADGTSRTLVGPEGSLWGVFGMEVDPRSGMLWVATNRVPEYGGDSTGDPGTAAIVSVDPYSGAVVSRFHLPVDAEAVLGDLTLGADGTVYTSDGYGGVYALDPRSGAWRTLLSAGVMTSPQGLALQPDGSALYVADYRGGILRIPLDGSPPAALRLPADTAIYGIDGMELWSDHMLVVINGSAPHRILELRLAPDGLSASAVRTLLRADPRFAEPTLATVRGGELLVVADSHWDSFGADGELPDEPLSGPTILAVPLDH